jgi:YhcH/YjgK/YiaL family protein
MIVDKLKNLGHYRGFSPLIGLAFDYLQGTDLCQLPAGRYEIQGNEVYALFQEYTTRTRDKGRWEAHHDFVDLHFVVQGEELMGFANITDLTSLGDYDAAKDAEHFEGDGIFFRVPEGYFVILGTEDAHMPCLESGRPAMVRKVVLKIRAR